MFVLIALLSAVNVTAQDDDPGGISGAVRDQGGGAIAGARVTLTDGAGKRITASSNWRGRYRLAAPATGTGTLTIEAAGFAPTNRPVTFSPETQVVDVTLRLAASTHVDVYGGVTGISLDSGQNMSTITLSGSALDVLPSDPHSLIATLQMLAGGAGTRADQVAIYIDGAPMDRRLPPRDIIQAIRINANPFSAEFQEPGPNRVEIITKPASAQFHGEGRFEFNDSKLNAQSPFEPERPPVQLRTITGYIGGPIQRERLGLLLYGGDWHLDENAVVDAHAVNVATFEPTAVRLNVPTPSRTGSVSAKADALLSRQNILVVEYTRDAQRAENSGLSSGFDLPERGYTSKITENTATARVTSTVSAAFLNEFRSYVTSRKAVDRAVSNGAAILVLDGFNGGGNADAQFRDNMTNRLLVSNASTWIVGQHSLRFGGQIDRQRFTQDDRANYNGTFTFGNDVVRNSRGEPVLTAGEPTALSALEVFRLTLMGTPGYRASQFSIVSGNPSVVFPVTTYALFGQDDWRVSSRLTVSAGIRSDSEDELLGHRVIAPRVGFAWSPSDGSRSVVRTGFGMFYGTIPSGIVSDVLRSSQSQRFVVNRPSFYPHIPATLSGAAVEVTSRTEAPAMSLPRTSLATVSYDRQIGRRLYSSLGYSWKHGSDLLRTRVVRQSAAGPTLQFESTGRSNAHELRATANGTVGSWLNVFSSYHFTRARQDTDGPYSVPSDSTALTLDWGRAPIPLHQLVVGTGFTLFEDLSITPFLKLASPLPFTITTGMDNNGDTQFTDRPALVDPTTPGAIVTAYGAFDPSPVPGQTIVERHSGNGPTEFSLDVAASWSLEGMFAGQDRGSVMLSVSNLTNRLNLAPFNGVLTSPFFGTANRALNPRRITLTARYDF